MNIDEISDLTDFQLIELYFHARDKYGTLVGAKGSSSVFTGRPGDDDYYDAEEPKTAEEACQQIYTLARVLNIPKEQADAKCEVLRTNWDEWLKKREDAKNSKDAKGWQFIGEGK